MSPRPLTVLRSHTVSVDAATFLCAEGGSDAGDDEHLVLATGSADGVVKLWNVDRRRVAHEYAAHAALGILALLPLHAQGQLVSHGRDGMLKLWDLSGGRCALAASLRSCVPTGSFTFCRSAVHVGSAPLPSGGSGDESGGEGVAGGGGGALGSTSLPPPPLPPPLPAAALGIGGGAACGRWIVAPSAESGVLHLWDTRAAGVSRTLDLGLGGHDVTGMCMALRSFETAGGGDALVACAFESGRVVIADLGTGRVAIDLKVDEEALLSVDVGASGARAVCAGASQRLTFVELDHATFTARVQASLPLPNRGIGRVVLRPCDEKIVATAGWDGRVRLWQWKRPKPALAVLREHTEAVHDVCFSPNGALLASVSKDCHAMLWSVYPPKASFS
jgi:WD40 repeat protein